MDDILTEIDDITIIRQDISSHVHGMVTLGSDYQPLIILNTRMPWEEQIKSLMHELEHIRRDDLFNEDFHEYFF